MYMFHKAAQLAHSKFVACRFPVQYIYAQYTMGWIIPQSLVVGRSSVDLARLYDAAEGTMTR